MPDFGDDQLRDRADPGVLEQGADLADHQLDLGRGRSRMLAQQALDAREIGQERLPDHGLEQLLLAREVQIERALADAGAGGDVVEPGGAEAALGEDLERGVDDLGGSRVLAPAPAPRGLG